MAETTGSGSGELRDASRAVSTEAPGSAFPELDVSLLEHSLSMTPWERMQANDDALNFAESLRAAMLKQHSRLDSRKRSNEPRPRSHHRAAPEGN